MTACDIQVRLLKVMEARAKLYLQRTLLEQQERLATGEQLQLEIMLRRLELGLPAGDLRSAEDRA